MTCLCDHCESHKCLFSAQKSKYLLLQSQATMKLLPFHLVSVAVWPFTSTLAHPGGNYSEHRVRGPCPALNTLSNHGILPRDGVNVSTQAIIREAERIYSVSSVAVIVKIFDEVTRVNDDGIRVIDYEDMFQFGKESSFQRQDFYFDPSGNQDPDLLEAIESAAGDDDILTLEELADFRDIRLRDSIERNPEAEYEYRTFQVMGFESAMFFFAFGSDPLVSTVPINELMSFVRDNKFPENFVPRTESGEPQRSWVRDPLLESVQSFFFDRAFDLVPLSSAADEPPDLIDCMASFTAMQFDIREYDQYHNYFREDSKVILPQAGQYVGPDAIEEYVRFTDESSPFIAEEKLLYSSLKFKEANVRTGMCTFLSMGITRQESTPGLGKEISVIRGALYQVIFDFHERYITELHVHFQPAYIDLIFSDVFNTKEVRSFICDVSEQDSCSETNAGMSHTECMQNLDELPLLSNGAFDGNDFGCRVLHSVFAAKNSDHCAHLSFEPQKDPSGEIKCQESAGMSSWDLFDEQDLMDFHDFLEEKESFIESLQGFKILDKPKQNSKMHQILFGAIVPLSIAIAAMTFMARTEVEDEKPTGSETVNVLLANKARQLRVLICVVLLWLVFSAGLTGLVLWLVVRSHFDWDSYPEPSTDFIDYYRGSPTHVSDTVPQQILSDEQFKVYVGVLVWLTVLVSGLGLEVFVWWKFLQVWSAEREAMWRFAQFIFPLMIMTALGLAIHQNFWALPIMVIGLWKFGFPETLMHLYLGMFSKAPFGLLRIADLIDGTGTVLHHGAASMIVSMIVVGVIPPSRYVFNCNLILVMQHLLVMVAYLSPTIYTGLVLLLEYYFEWIIMCKLTCTRSHKTELTEWCSFAYGQRISPESTTFIGPPHGERA